MSSTSSPATTTTTRPEYSFDDSVPPPKLVNTGTNYVAILKSLESYSNWLTAYRPDPALTSAVNAHGTDLYAGFARTLTILRTKRQRLVERTRGTDRVTIISSTANSFSAALVQQISSHTIIDAGHHVVREAHFKGATAYAILAVRAGDRWYLASSAVTTAPIRLS